LVVVGFSVMLCLVCYRAEERKVTSHRASD
jgi:hypothetical protein